ncbi:MAG: hypothetical protein ACRBN8_46605 [Nannocystales bacterium]
MRRFWVAPLMLCACFAPSVPSSEDSMDMESSSSSSGSGGPATDGETADSSGASSTGVEETTAVTGEPGALEITLTLDGFAEPATVLEHETMVLSVDAEGADRVAFYEGPDLIAELSEPPFEVALPFASQHNGDRKLSAVAVAGEDEAEDDLTVAVNIGGGDITALLENIFRASVPAGATRAGGVTVRDGRVFAAGPGEDLVGEIYVVTEEMALAWSVQTEFPLVDGPHALPDALVVGYDNGPLWRAATFSVDDGSPTEDWVLGAAATGSDAPFLHTTDRIWATTNPTTVAAFSSAGSELSSRHDFAAPVTAVGGHPSGALVSLSGRPDCSEPSTCLAQLTTDGEPAWEVAPGLGFEEAEASGRFLAATVRDGEDGFRIAVLGPDGEVEVERHFVPETGGADGRIAAVVETPAGGAVLCGYEWVEEQGTVAWVAHIDEMLDVVWEASPDPGAGVLVYGCDASAEGAYIYGLSDADAVLVGNEVILQGPAWLARISL